MNEEHHFEIEFCRSILRRDRENLGVMEMLAGYFTKAGRIDEGLELDRAITRLDPENPVSHYNLACSLSLKRHKREALDVLRVALEKGYADFVWMMKDPDLKNLHDDPGFSSLISEFQIR